MGRSGGREARARPSGPNAIQADHRDRVHILEPRGAHVQRGIDRSPEMTRDKAEHHILGLSLILTPKTRRGNSALAPEFQARLGRLYLSSPVAGASNTLRGELVEPPAPALRRCFALRPSLQGAKQHRHSEERSDEESAVGLVLGSPDPPPQTPRFTRGDIFRIPTATASRSSWLPWRRGRCR